MAPILSILGGKHKKINLEFVEKDLGVKEIYCWGLL